MSFSLKEIYDYIFPPKSKLGFERLTPKISEKLNIITVISKLMDIEELKIVLAKNDFNYIGSKNNFHTFKTSYEKYDEVSKRIVKVTVEYKLYIDNERGVLLFFTTSNKGDVEKTLVKLIENQYGFYYAFLSPKVFENIKEKILSENYNAIIPYFTVIRRPYYRFSCKIRPSEERTFTYQSGSDGRETLEEFKQYYGMLPRVIEFNIPQVVNLRIDYRGIFSFKSGKIDYVDNLINFTVSNIIESKRIIEKSKLDIVEVETTYKKILVPKVSSWSIRFSKNILFEEIESIISLLSKGKFFVTNSYIEKGSLLWSATVLDYQKNSIFNIKSNENKLFVLPRYEPKFDSLLRFYQFFIENIDEDAVIEESK
jgi:hypothetical protein